jgi:hypothetical protein
MIHHQHIDSNLFGRIYVVYIRSMTIKGDIFATAAPVGVLLLAELLAHQNTIMLKVAVLPAPHALFFLSPSIALPDSPSLST